MSAFQAYARPFHFVLQELVDAHERELREARLCSMHERELRELRESNEITMLSDLRLGTARPPGDNAQVAPPTTAWTNITPMAPTALPGVLHDVATTMPCDEMKTAGEPNPPMPVVEPQNVEDTTVEPDDEKQKTPGGEQEVDYAEHAEKRMTNMVNEEGEMLGMFAHLVGPFVRLGKWWTNLAEPERSGALAHIAQSTRFSLGCTFVILLNSVYTFAVTDQAMDQVTHEISVIHGYIEIAFMSFYLFEILLKLWVHGLYFFCNEEMSWNIFDFLLVMQGVLDVVMMFFEVEVMKATFARLLRILKLGKIFRVFRAIRFLRDLRVLMSSIVSSFAALMWSLVLLALCLYMCSIAFVQLLTSFLVEEGDNVDEQTAEEIFMFFGSVLRGMRTLFMCTSGGIDWFDIQVIIINAGPMGEAFLLGFLCFWHFSIVNIITGIVMEKAVRNSQPDRDTIMMEQRFQREVDAAALKQIFHDLDDDQSGTVNQVEFAEKLSDKKLLAYLATLDINVSDLENLFKLLVDAAGCDEIGIETFVHQCIQMKGFATALDLNVMMFQVQMIQGDVQTVNASLASCQSSLQKLGKHLAVPAA